MVNGVSSTIDVLITDNPPRSKSLIVSLLGDAIEPRGGSFWIKTLIELIRKFDINERSVRTSVQRLTQDRWLRSKRHGRRSRYSLTPEGRARIVQARPRIYNPAHKDWNGVWTVALAPPGSLESWQRLHLRKYLEWEGYSMGGSGVFVHPLGDPENISEILSELDIRDKVYVFRAESLPSGAMMTLSDAVSDFWDLEKARGYYKDFLAKYGALRDRLLENYPDLTDEQCFKIRLLTVHAFRRASLHAPRLPASLLPANWPGLDAYRLTASIYQQVWEPAERHLDATFEACHEPHRSNDPRFFERFGGLSYERSVA